MNLLLGLIILSLFSNNIEVKNDWIRASFKGSNTACFMQIVNNSAVDDTLYKVETKIAEINEIHETYFKDDKMGMRKIEYLVIPANGTVELKPRSLHLMLINLQKDLTDGTSVDLSLFFKSGKIIKLKSPVKEMIRKKQNSEQK